MKISDCTLRDGEYYTFWNFSKNIFENYLKTISKLNISISELGYLSKKMRVLIYESYCLDRNVGWKNFGANN